MSGMCGRVWLCAAVHGIAAASAWAGGQTEPVKITASDAAVGDMFGIVAINGDIAVVS